jgi:hypothetical protein
MYNESWAGVLLFGLGLVLELGWKVLHVGNYGCVGCESRYVCNSDLRFAIQLELER